MFYFVRILAVALLAMSFIDFLSNRSVLATFSETSISEPKGRMLDRSF